MSAEPNALGLARPARWRYSLRTLMLVVFFVALGLTDFRLRGGGLHDAWNVGCMALSAALLCGIALQMRDFQRTARRPGLSAEARWGLRAAIAWRFSAALMLVVFHVVEHLPADVMAADYPSMTLRIVPANRLYYLALILIIAGTRQLAGRRCQVRSMLRTSLDMIAVTVILSVFLFDLLTGHFLVYLALMGIEVARSPIKLPLLEGVNPLPVARAEPAFWLGLGTAVLVPVCFGLIYLCSRKIASRRGRTLARMLLAFALLAMTGMFCWNYFVALPTVSPWLLAQSSEASVWHFALLGVPCFLVLTAALAYRWSARATTVEAATSEVSPSPLPYFHERRWLIGMLAITLAFDTIRSYFGLSAFRSLRETWLDLVTFGRIWLDLFHLNWWSNFAAGVIEEPLPIAALLVVLHGAFAQWRRRNALSPAGAPELSPGRFVFVWVAVTATTAVAIPSLAIYGFVLWMAQWYL